MRVAITGVAGFIGSNLALRLLSDGHDVIGVDNLSYGPREQVPDGVDLRVLDIRDPSLHLQLRRCDALYHLAAKNCIADCQDDPVETSDVNVTGTANVFRAAVKADVPRVIYAESSALYEGATKYPTPESDIAPRSFYSVSKAAGMLFADAFARFTDIQATALRYFCVYGPRQDYRRTIPPVMSAFIIALLHGKRPTVYGTGNKRRDFIYIDDVNDFHMLCLREKLTIGRTYNLGSGVGHSVNEIYAMVAELLDSATMPEYRADLPGEAEQTLADITQAAELGWAPKTSLRNGLSEMIKFIRTEVLKIAPPQSDTLLL